MKCDKCGGETNTASFDHATSRTTCQRCQGWAAEVHSGKCGPLPQLIPSPSIDIHKPDPWLAFAALAPLVAEARVYLETGHPDQCAEILEQARKVIERVTMWGVVWTVPKPEAKGD